MALAVGAELLPALDRRRRRRRGRGRRRWGWRGSARSPTRPSQTRALAGDALEVAPGEDAARPATRRYSVASTQAGDGRAGAVGADDRAARAARRHRSSGPRRPARPTRAGPSTVGARADLNTGGGGRLEQDRVERHPAHVQHRRADACDRSREISTRRSSKARSAVLDRFRDRLERRLRRRAGRGPSPRRAGSRGSRACRWGSGSRSTRQTFRPALESRVASGEPAQRAPTTITSNFSMSGMPTLL